MAKLRRLSTVLAGCILSSGLVGAVSAQPRMERDWDGGREWQERDWNPDRGRDWRERDRWDRDRRWRDRDRDCYYETRRYTNRFGERVIRRYRICED
ncbi:hypothetical protein [Microvirga pakistanensis]|uniref:hypothetical protein n=1 Tax=Microvirga pakistanensis TaxID=1682650 RepID=UPI00106BFCDB|nr:hypothetical protein [Microvirga pakistanensis]